MCGSSRRALKERMDKREEGWEMGGRRDGNKLENSASAGSAERPPTRLKERAERVARIPKETFWVLEAQSESKAWALLWRLQLGSGLGCN